MSNTTDHISLYGQVFASLADRDLKCEDALSRICYRNGCIDTYELQFRHLQEALVAANTSLRTLELTLKSTENDLERSTQISVVLRRAHSLSLEKLRVACIKRAKVLMIFEGARRQLDAVHHLLVQLGQSSETLERHIKDICTQTSLTEESLERSSVSVKDVMNRKAVFSTKCARVEEWNKHIKHELERMGGTTLDNICSDNLDSSVLLSHPLAGVELSDDSSGRIRILKSELCLTRIRLAHMLRKKLGSKTVVCIEFSGYSSRTHRNTSLNQQLIRYQLGDHPIIDLIRVIEGFLHSRIHKSRSL